MSRKKSTKRRKRKRREEAEEGRKDERKQEQQEEEQKHAPAPRADAHEEESASGLFKEAIAAFEKAEAPPADGRERGAPETKREERDGSAKGGGKPEPEVEKAESAEAGEKGEERREEEGAAEEVSPETPGGRRDESEDAVEAPKAETEAEEIKEAKETKEAEEIEEAEAAEPAADRMVRKALHKRGEPGEEIEAYEPKDYELHGAVVKFECRCGKRVSAPADVKRPVGRCPKCGVRLVLPRPQKTGENAPATSMTRLVAFQIDLAVPAALFFALFYLLGSLGVEEATYLTIALAVAGGAWLTAAIVLPSTVSASLGMLVVGLRYRGPDGRSLSFIEAVGRAVTGVVLSPLAPLALADPRRRTTADHVTGCVVVPAAEGTTEGSAEAKDAPDTVHKRHRRARGSRTKPR